MSQLVIGIDFGTDSVRALLVNSQNGKEIGQALSEYSRWGKGFYCDPEKSMFRHHPIDYIESLEECLKGLLDEIDEDMRSSIVGISVSTTGSTPVAVDSYGNPLSMNNEFNDDPDGMFILWKDHTAIKEALEINELAWKWKTDYTKYSGGLYSSEWFWSKILHTVRNNRKVFDSARSWIELSDWIPALLTGYNCPADIKRNRCAAGHKAMWHEEFGGLPSEEFLVRLDDRLAGVREKLYQQTYTSDMPAGNLSLEWAEKLGLSTDVLVGIGGIDAHFGAVGSNIRAHTMVKVIGTSTCDMVILPNSAGDERLVKGICGQVQGSIVPNMLGLEAGQSAFGDIFDWFVGLLSYGADVFAPSFPREEIKASLLRHLNEAAAELPVTMDDIVILDWINGRRTPDVDMTLKSWIVDLDLSTDAPKIFKALVEAAAYGSRSIVERFEDENVEIYEITATGGISKKSPFVMQILANVLNKPIKVVESNQSGALGAAMYAAVVSGIYSDISEAQDKMFTGYAREYYPQIEKVNIYNKLYEKYMWLGEVQEKIK